MIIVFIFAKLVFFLVIFSPFWIDTGAARWASGQSKSLSVSLLLYSVATRSGYLSQWTSCLPTFVLTAKHLSAAYSHWVTTVDGSTFMIWHVYRSPVYCRVNTERQTIIQANIHTYGQFRITSSTVDITHEWGKAEAPGENPHEHGNNMQTPHRRPPAGTIQS